MPSIASLPRSYAAVRTRLCELPVGPGIYQFHDRAGRLLYVGKSVSLRARVRSYFGSAAGRSRKLRRLRSRVGAVEWTETGSELEALLIESRMVKERHPPFNTLLHRHRHLVFLRLDLTDPFPRLEVTEQLRRDGSRYFGPLVLTADAERLAAILSDALRLRTCDPPGHRVPLTPPCLRRDLGLCHAPCVSHGAGTDYAQAALAAARAFDREGQPFRERLRAEMSGAAERLLFERAARLRDALQTLEELSGRQQAVISAIDSLDLVAACPSRAAGHLELFLFRSGSFVAQQSLPHDRLRLPEVALETARDLLRHCCDVRGGIQGLPERPADPRAATPRTRSAGPSSTVEPELLDQLFIISRWLRRNSGEGSHFFLPPDEKPNFLAQRLAAWLREAALDRNARPPTPADPRSSEAELIADWAEQE